MVLKKILKLYPNSQYINRINYYRYYKKLKIDDNAILLESQHGDNLNGNIFYLLKELNKNNYGLKIYVVAKKNRIDNFNSLLSSYNINSFEIVKMFSKKYFRLCASAKYLINDTSFLPFFIKKDGQIYLNTWHGTPFKTLGRKDKTDYYNLGNVQRNFIFADYLLYPNEYTKKHIIEDYMLENTSTAKTIVSGYPRNSVFFTDSSDTKNKIINIMRKKGVDINNKQLIAYMPTWRGNLAASDTTQTDHIYNLLLEIDNKLNDDQIMFVNLHPFVSDTINYEEFKNIFPFPTEIETYDFLNACNLLVTDYSSVFFDFALTHKKIILFAYDKEEYLKDRGIYFQFEELPFTICKTVSELIKELSLPINYDDKEFINTFCSNDSAEASTKLLKLLIKDDESNLLLNDIPNNNKKKVLIYVGNLAKNGITSSVMSLLRNVDLDKRNYYITFSAARIRKNKEIIKTIDDRIKYIPLSGKMNASLFQRLVLKVYRHLKLSQSIFNKMFDELYSNEIRRCYYDVYYDNVIQFNGYEYKRQLMFGRFKGNKIIFVHSNMSGEMSVRNNQHQPTIEYAYKHYDKVAIVSEDIREATEKISKRSDNIYLVENTIDFNGILDKAKSDVFFDEDTDSTVSLENLKSILYSQNKVFITIGRFSPEKGHRRLIDAFYKLWINNKNTNLIIIGGLGIEYQNTLNYIAKLPCKDSIVLIKSLSNPYAILSKCDFFVLSSFYEGLGLVLLEANIVGLPIMSTDITGPRNFMKKYGGFLCDNSEEGLFNGMVKMLEGKIKPIKIDYKEYNKKAIEEFESILE